MEAAAGSVWLSQTSLFLFFPGCMYSTQVQWLHAQDQSYHKEVRPGPVQREVVVGSFEVAPEIVPCLWWIWPNCPALLWSPEGVCGQVKVNLEIPLYPFLAKSRPGIVRTSFLRNLWKVLCLLLLTAELVSPLVKKKKASLRLVQHLLKMCQLTTLSKSGKRTLSFSLSGFLIAETWWGQGEEWEWLAYLVFPWGL
jgi:hypothetical protein